MLKLNAVLVIAMVEHRQGVLVTVELHVEVLGHARRAFHLGHVDGRHLRKHIDEGTCGAVLEPITAHITVIERLEQAERVVHVGYTLAEVVTVVVLLQIARHVFVGQSLLVGHHPQLLQVPHGTA